MLIMIASTIPRITTTRTTPLAVLGFPAPSSFATRVLQNNHHVNLWDDVTSKNKERINQEKHRKIRICNDQ